MEGSGVPAKLPLYWINHPSECNIKQENYNDEIIQKTIFLQVLPPEKYDIFLKFVVAMRILLSPNPTKPCMLSI